MSKTTDIPSRETLSTLLKQTRKRLKRANEKAGALKKQHAGKTNSQATPDSESKTVINYNGGWSLGYWEGRAAALEDVEAWIEDALSGRLTP